MSLLAVIGDGYDYTAIYYKASPYTYIASTDRVNIQQSVTLQTITENNVRINN